MVTGNYLRTEKHVKFVISLYAASMQMKHILTSHKLLGLEQLFTHQNTNSRPPVQMKIHTIINKVVTVPSIQDCHSHRFCRILPQYGTKLTAQTVCIINRFRQLKTAETSINSTGI